MVDSHDEFTDLVVMLHKQLIKSGLSTQYESEYRKIIGYVLTDQNLSLSIESVNDYLFELITVYPEPSRTKALWLFSLIDDYQNNRISERLPLPIKCKECKVLSEFKTSKLNYECPKCFKKLMASKADYWLKR